MTDDRHLLRDRDVALLWSAGLVSWTGTLAMFVALPVAVFEASGSPLATALTALAGAMAPVLAGQVAGVVADRLDRRTLLVATNLVMAALTGCYLLLAAGPWWGLAGASLVIGGVAQLLGPTEHALLSEVVPAHRLGEGASLNALNNNLARLVGPAAGGTLYAVGGLPAVVVLDLLSFALAAALVAGVSRHRASTPARPLPGGSWAADWVAGLRAVWGHPTLRPLVLLVAVVAFGEGFISALLAPFAFAVIDGDAQIIGWILSAQAIGGVAGAWYAGRVTDRREPLAQLGWSALAAGLLLLVIFNYALVYPHPWPAVVLTALAGAPFAVFGATQGYALQVCAPAGLRGRVFSAAFGLSGLSQLTGIAVAGLSAEHWGLWVINVDALAYLCAGATAVWLARRPADGSRTRLDQRSPRGRWRARVTSSSTSSG